jgi:hypothetical protein
VGLPGQYPKWTSDTSLAKLQEAHSICGICRSNRPDEKKIASFIKKPNRKTNTMFNNNNYNNNQKEKQGKCVVPENIHTL